MKKDHSHSLHIFKSKEQLGDALLKFLASEIYTKKFGTFNEFTGSHVIPIDLFISNYALIQIAEDMLDIKPHPEDMAKAVLKQKLYYRDPITKELVDKNDGKDLPLPKKPLANAFEAHLYEIFQSQGFDTAYQFVEKYVFSDYLINKLKKRSPQYFTEEIHT